MDLIPLRSRILRTAGLIFLIIVLLFLLVDVPAAIAAARQSDWSEWAIGTVFLLVTYALIPLRTRYLVGHGTSYRDTLYADSSGFMFSILLQIPNSAIRALALNRSADVDASRVTSAMTLEVMTGWLVRGLVFAMAVSLFAADKLDAQRPLLTSILVVAGLFMLLIVLARNSKRVQRVLSSGLGYVPRVSDKRAEQIAGRSSESLQHMASVRRFTVTLLLTILIWIASFAFYFFSFEAMGIDLGGTALLITLAALVVAPPSSPLMIGVFHGAIIAILGTLRLLDADDAAGYAMLLHFMQLIIVTTFGFIGLRKMDLRFREILREVRNRGKQDPDGISQAQ